MEQVRGISLKAKFTGEEVEAEFLTNTPVQKFGQLVESFTSGDTQYF